MKSVTIKELAAISDETIENYTKEQAQDHKIKLKALSQKAMPAIISLFQTVGSDLDGNPADEARAKELIKNYASGAARDGLKKLDDMMNGLMSSGFFGNNNPLPKVSDAEKAQKEAMLGTFEDAAKSYMDYQMLKPVFTKQAQLIEDRLLELKASSSPTPY